MAKLTHNEIAELCRKVIAKKLGIREEDVPSESWDHIVYDFAKENVGRTNPENLQQEFQAKVDEIIYQALHFRKYWENALQRHHDYYVLLQRQGKLSYEDDEKNYVLAMEREHNGLVKPLPENATSSFG